METSHDVPNLVFDERSIAQSTQARIYTVLQKYAHIGLKQNLLRSTTLDIIAILLDNAAFVCVHVVGRLSKDFSEVRGSRSRGFLLQVEWMTTEIIIKIMKRGVNILLITSGDCVIESEHGGYECVMFVPYLNNKDRHGRYN